MALASSACVRSFIEAPILDLSLAQKVVVCGIIRWWRHLLDVRRNKPPCSLFSYVPFFFFFFSLLWLPMSISALLNQCLLQRSHRLSPFTVCNTKHCLCCLSVCLLSLLKLLIFVCAANLPIASSRLLPSPLFETDCVLRMQQQQLLNNDPTLVVAEEEEEDERWKRDPFLLFSFSR